MKLTQGLTITTGNFPPLKVLVETAETRGEAIPIHRCTPPFTETPLPLKVLVETAEARGEAIPGLVYEGNQIKLGLGDFVFYSLLVGRASLRSTAALVACAVAVLAGLCATLALLPVLERVLPALPISIAAGILFYFASWLMIEPLAAAAAQRSLFL